MKTFPQTLGACIDMLYKTRGERLKKGKEMEKTLQKYKDEENRIEKHIIDTFEKDKIEGARGKLATASITKLTVANITDWETFCRWAAKTKSWDMFKRSINNKAYRARLDAKKKVPGTEKYVDVGLSLNKR